MLGKGLFARSGLCLGRMPYWKRRTRETELRSVVEGFSREQSAQADMAAATGLNPTTLQAEEPQSSAGSGSAGSLPFPKRPRKLSEQAAAREMKRGADIAEKAKYLSDPEWSVLSLDDRHAFTRYLGKKIKEAPADVTEQQKRRYYEQTLLDPSKVDPHRTVTDAFQRIKLGLPVEVASSNTLGVTRAMYDEGNADLFDPNHAERIENAMTNLKQKFVDYIRHRKEGLATEAERRELANLSAELNYNTQKHLADMFKYAEQKLYDAALHQRKDYLNSLHSLKRKLRKTESKKANRNKTQVSATQNGSKSSEQADQAEMASNKIGSAVVSPKKNRKSKSKPKKDSNWRRVQLRRVLRDSFGLDLDTVKVLVKESRAQEEFMQYCEVFARMTLGKGFEHTKEDENLDSYVESRKNLYTTDPSRFGQLDPVQYSAALEGTPSHDWALRWFQRALLVPIQSTPEYRRLQEIKAEEEEAIRLQQEAATEGTAKPKPRENPAELREKKVLSLVEKMFVAPEDPRMQSQHEKRLRHLAYTHMESQISRMREYAKAFEGAENTKEAEQCRAWYAELTQLKNNVPKDETPFDHPKIRELYEKIQNVVRIYIQEHNAVKKADKTLRSAKKAMTSLERGDAKAAMAELKRLNSEKKRQQVERMLRLLERDVREDMLWLENVKEGERPPLLPVPEPLSYVSAADIHSWKGHREEAEKAKGNPFKNSKVGPGGFQASFMGIPWEIPNKPILFWGTGVAAVQQSLRHAAEDAERRRSGKPLAPEYPCAENPFGWRLKHNILDG
jgi:hypothetical protein